MSVLCIIALFDIVAPYVVAIHYRVQGMQLWGTFGFGCFNIFPAQRRALRMSHDKVSYYYW